MWVQGDWIELPRTDVKLKEELGEGAFGEVYKGEVQIDGEKLPCAVKKVKGKLLPTFLITIRLRGFLHVGRTFLAPGRT